MCVRLPFLALVVSFGLCGAAVADQARQAGIAQPSSFMRIYGPANPPYGFIRFCETNPRECADAAVADQRLYASPERLSELDEVNRAVNTAIQAATDLELYGVSEYWTIPATKGDCEDYALLKRRILIGRGWPVSSLLMTVVRDEQGEGHAVLTARTAQGDFILDNKVDVVRVWFATPYEYVMRQSYLNAKAWVSLDATSPSSPALMAGVKARR